jgi:hypothetical protein
VEGLGVDRRTGMMNILKKLSLSFGLDSNGSGRGTVAAVDTT